MSELTEAEIQRILWRKWGRNTERNRTVKYHSDPAYRERRAKQNREAQRRLQARKGRP